MGIYTNLPNGATHISSNGVFFKQYTLPKVTVGNTIVRSESQAWLRWDTYHKSWVHHDGYTRVELL